IDPERRVYVNDAQFCRLQSGGTGQLHAISVLQPSIVAGFAGVLVAGACLTESLLFHLWSRQEVRFAPARFCS
ncbi:hypothetical protein WDZ92_33060, partial [Nostoc sp. NIES-2111]